MSEISLPHFLMPFRAKALAFLKEKRINDIAFSDSTYQVHILDPQIPDGAWAFLQLDLKGRIKDCFCSCEMNEDVSKCVHIATAYLALYGEHSLPLHQRFARSFWNQICQLFADRLGYSQNLLQTIEEGSYVIHSSFGKEVFFAKARHPEGVKILKQLFEQRSRETEENSLKFSNLPQDEIVLWREGRPSSKLRYELSFWSDVAKWMITAEEQGRPYQMTFTDGPHGLPDFLEIQFDEITLGFYLSQEILTSLIPALAAVKSPLSVHSLSDESIEEIQYDKEEGSLHIKRKAEGVFEKQQKDRQEYFLEGWIYVPNDGFYAREQKGLFAHSVLTGREVAEALNDHFDVVEKHLVGTPLRDSFVKARYHIEFDRQWHLHIECYVFEPGDLTKQPSRYFGEWIYLDQKGFYRIEGVEFDQCNKIIPRDEVADFVSKYRGWFNYQEGFHIHLSSLETPLSYVLTNNNQLIFNTSQKVNDAPVEYQDFGTWIYVKGVGFYSKTSSHLGLSLRPGIVVNREYIPAFIRANRDELHLVPDFFNPKNPIISSSVVVELGKQGMIHIKPTYEVHSDYSLSELRFFGDFIFAPGNGFYELPMDLRLPELFQRPFSIPPGEEQDVFLKENLPNLAQYSKALNAAFQRPSHLELQTTQMETVEGEYQLKLAYVSNFGSVDATVVWNAIKHKQRFLCSPAGLLDLNDDRYSWLKNLSKNDIDRKTTMVKLSTLDILRLNAFDYIKVSLKNSEEHEHASQLLRDLTDLKPVQDPDLHGLKSHLRPYQLNGVRWLWYLYQHGLSGLLCDDMGLGKTHQAMAIFAAIVNSYKEENLKNSEVVKAGTPRYHFLVVCPTSVIYHWQEKLQSFLPHLKVYTFYGLNRDVATFIQDYDVLLTSYGIWRKECELLKTIPFDLAIFDEIQVAKNHRSQIHAALLKVQAKMCLGMTGTPIENHLRELKSLFDIVLPTYMPSEHVYIEFFVKPIEKDSDAYRKNLLSRYIKPFVLRRKKEDVLSDLPEKTEEVAHCALLHEQKNLYMDILNQSRSRLIQELRNEKLSIPYLHVFALLSSLKQICNHPAAYFKRPAEYKKHHSGKWELFVELLNEARESSQKVVVFSQYLAMLDIMEYYLKEHHIHFASIRGSTTDRGEQLRRFTHDPQCEVFLGSLQASGLGIDLTAASVVIHYDRWWNAARENQATDRVHRIGQTRGVQVFKLVTKETFEEKIDAMIQRKGVLMEEIVGIDEHQVIKNFNRNDLIELLQNIGVEKDNPQALLFEE